MKNLIEAVEKLSIDSLNAAVAGIAKALEALNASVEQLLGDVYVNLKALLGNALNGLVDAAIEAVKKYAPMLADEIYYYLLNNPEEVIAFFNEYGDEILELMEEYGDEVLAVIAIVLYLYGDDIVEYVIENHEDILAALIEWLEIHGENTAKLLQVYAEALGICDAVRDQIADLENAIADLEAEIRAQIAALEAQLAALKAQLENAVGEARAELERLIAELEALIPVIEAALEAKLAELKAAIAELEAALDEAIEIGMAKFDEVKTAAEKVYAEIMELVEAVRDYVAHITNGQVYISDDTFYLAIITEDSEKYADMVAEKLWLNENQYKKVTMEEVTAEDLARATIITVGYNAVSAVEFAVDQMKGVANDYVQMADDYVRAIDEKLDAAFPYIETMLKIDIYTTVMEKVNAEIGEYLSELEGKEVTELDWVSMVGEENVPYVEAALEALRNALIVNGVPENLEIDVVKIASSAIAQYLPQVSDMSSVEKQMYDILGEYATIEIPVVDPAVFVVESALYEFVSYNKEYANNILAINAINPEATVVLLGNYNRFIVDYEFITEEMNIALVDVLSKFGIEEFALPAEVEKVLSIISGSEVDVEKLIAEYNYTIESRPVTVTEVLDLVANITSVHPFAYSLVFRNMFYVDICDARESGDEYITEQIMNGLDVFCIHIYDNECTDTDCNRCGAVRVAPGHKPSKPTTCTEDTICTVCGEILEEGFGHTPGAPADCTNAQICTVCGATLAVALGHRPGPAADCTTDQVCTVCGEVFERAKGHRPGAAATCTTDQVCTVCGVVIAKATGHKPGAAATCTTDQVCTVCGVVIAKATGHKPGAAATCTTDQKCTVCGEILAKATGHKAGAAATCTTDQKCTVCGEILAKATGHKAGAAATCTTDQKCTVCGEVLAKATGHKAGAAATCTDDQKCTVCGEILAKATGHKWIDATCTAPKTCSVCKVTEGTTAPHSFGDWVVTKEAAAGVDGEKTRTCTVCGATETEIIPAQPVDPDKVVPTGAVVGIVAISVVMVAGACVSVLLALKKKD